MGLVKELALGHTIYLHWDNHIKSYTSLHTVSIRHQHCLPKGRLRLFASPNVITRSQVGPVYTTRVHRSKTDSIGFLLLTELLLCPSLRQMVSIYDNVYNFSIVLLFRTHAYYLSHWLYNIHKHYLIIYVQIISTFLICIIDRI